MDVCPYCKVAVDVGICGEKQIYLCRNPQCVHFGTPLAAVTEEALTGSIAGGTMENGSAAEGAMIERNAADGTTAVAGQAQKSFKGEENGT